MEEIVGVSRVAAELMYPFAIVRDQAVIYVYRDLRQIGLEDIPIRRVHVNGLLLIV